MAVPADESIIMACIMGLNTNPGEEELAFNYESSESCNRLARIPFELAISQSNYSVSLATIDTLKWVLVVDKAGTGMSVGKASGAGKFNVRAFQFMLISESASFTVYIDNPSATDKLFGEIIVLGSNS